jgi:hypothetical protein
MAFSIVVLVLFTELSSAFRNGDICSSFNFGVWALSPHLSLSLSLSLFEPVFSLSKMPLHELTLSATTALVVAPPNPTAPPRPRCHSPS